MPRNAEQQRLEEKHRGIPWRKWGPYVSARQWGTVREDYSADGSAWDYFPHDHARSRAYRWGEDGLAGLCDAQQRLCLGIALWNEKDAILKERLFGLTGPQGNHGEDVKELYYYLDATPTQSYLKMLYKYPQRAYPYADLVAESARRTRKDPEYELLDTGIFDDDAYFDVFVEYAKNGVDDVLMLITAINRGKTAAPLHILPHVWFRNTWSWQPDAPKPSLWLDSPAPIVIGAQHPTLGRYSVHLEGECEVLFCENQTNAAKLFGAAQSPAFPKDAINDFVVARKADAVNRERIGTKAAGHYFANVPPGGTWKVRVRLTNAQLGDAFSDFDGVMDQRRQEADAFYAELQGSLKDDDARHIQRQALAGMIWCKQYYGYDVRRWLAGDPTEPTPPTQRLTGRNSDWVHLNNNDIISMPDNWEYPWYASWDLAFHCVTMSLIDPDFAKAQLVLLTREWYMHPNGQIPAYEWSFSDVNPPLQAWAAWRVFQIDRQKHSGKGDLRFLERVFHKLLLNFTWWVNRKDVQGRNIFQGGFLGLDNIGMFDRSAKLPTGGYVSQADGTSWMAMYCLTLMRIALELAGENPVYQDLATKFFEHFLFIAAAMTNMGGQGIDLWSEEDGFYYDVLSLPEGQSMQIRLRSLVGLIPLFAVEVLKPELLKRVPEFTARLEWFLNYRPDLAKLVSRWNEPGGGETRLLSLLRGHRMKALFRHMLDTNEFLSPYGIRALSRQYLQHPFVCEAGGQSFTVKYEPGESESGLFGGNSNWRGPIWMPTNYLLIESIWKFHQYYGDDFKFEQPTGSGKTGTICQAADDIAQRLTNLFRRDAQGKRAIYNHQPKLQNDPNFRDHLLFYEYFHGDTGRGVGASHQTGWTGLIALLLAPDHVTMVRNSL